MKRPSFIGHYRDFIDEDNSRYDGYPELLGIGSAVGKKLGLTRIGIHIETLLPGRRTSFPHAESDEEEFGFILEGEVDVWVDGNIYPLKVGDFVAFPAGTAICHTFINNSHQTARLLIGGEAQKKTNKIIYALHPDLNQRRKEKGDFWESAPLAAQGIHDGKSNLERDGLAVKSWTHTTITTENLLIRGYKMEDAESIFKFGQKPSVTKFISWGPFSALSDLADHIKKRQFNSLQAPDLAICFKSNPDIVIGGICAFWANRNHKVLEIGIALDDVYWGKGIMYEAAVPFIKFCWDHFDINRIQAMCRSDNINSYRMLSKLGMKHEGTMRSAVFMDGESWDMELFSLVRPEN